MCADLHNLKNSRVAVFQRAQKKGGRVYLFGAPAKATVEAEEEACGLAAENEDRSDIFLTQRVQVRKFVKNFVRRCDDSITLKTLVWLSFRELRRRERGYTYSAQCVS